MQPDQLETLLDTLKAEHAALAEVIKSLERYRATRWLQAAKARNDGVQQARLSGFNPKTSRTAVKGAISIRKAIAEVLQETKRELRAQEIWDFAYEKGARTDSKRPAAIVALTCAGMDEVEKVGPRMFKWKGQPAG